MVYFIREGEDGPIKIGFAVNVKTRLSHLRSANPRRLSLVAEVPGDVGVERVLHRWFAPGRLEGEWFAPDTPGLAELLHEIVSCERMEDAEILGEVWNEAYAARVRQALKPRPADAPLLSFALRAPEINARKAPA